MPGQVGKEKRGGSERYLEKDGYMFPVSCMAYTVHWHASKKSHDSRPGGSMPIAYVPES